MALFDVALDHLVHDQIGVNADPFLDSVRVHGPSALDEDRASGCLAVDSGRDAIFAAQQGQREGGLAYGSSICDLICDGESQYCLLQLGVGEGNCCSRSVGCCQYSEPRRYIA